ncbi:MAG TPA: hypothetical protein VM537_25865 [Anaerolineae bacterium]|nr:hypothetical protein [Anaerolineae bacterium]
MTIYRVTTTTPFADGRRKGDLILRGDYSERVMAGLIKNGKISKASTPPLSVLPGFSLLAKRMADIGIITVEQFIETDPEVILKALGWTQERTVIKWKDRAAQALCIEPAPEKNRRR